MLRDLASCYGEVFTTHCQSGVNGAEIEIKPLPLRELLRNLVIQQETDRLLVKWLSPNNFHLFLLKEVFAWIILHQ